MIDHIKIMQFADGTLEPNEREKVKKEIDLNPEYQQILNDYIETGDLLNNLGNELKSLELPKNLKNKIFTFNQSNQSNLKREEQSFNIFSFFNIRYSAIAAAFAIVFLGGFYANQLVPPSNNLPIAQQLSEETNIKLRGSNTEFITSFYKWFNEKDFINEVNSKINNLNEGDKFLVETKDKNNASVNFVIGKIIKDTDNKCRAIYYDKKVSLQNSNKSFQISLAVCNENDKWILKAITLN